MTDHQFVWIMLLLWMNLFASSASISRESVRDAIVDALKRYKAGL